ncbi:MAG: hypothetical protein JRN52_08165 [Nitrososphaerota archaeon]|nr:hypothetical protein [Nitrososphaerota archaeon]
MEQQSQYQQVSNVKLEHCSECGKSFAHVAYLDHLFVNKACMRKYWEEEEKNHIARLRQRTMHHAAK